MDIGLFHPGEMGVTVGNSLGLAGHRVYWASSGRSAATRVRAEKAGLIELTTQAALLESCPLVVSVCPPQFALDMAQTVCGHGFSGAYVDVNAISPQTARHLADLCARSGIDFVDGSLIGPPAWTTGTTTLYLCGPSAHRVADCFVGGHLTVVVLEAEIGAASALKMCDSAFNKGLLAVLYQTLAVAEKLGVRDQLQAIWDSNPGGAGQVSTENRRICRSARKSWRFVPEMNQVIETVRALGLKDDIFRNARDIFRPLACFDPDADLPSEAEVLAALLARSDQSSQKRG